MATKLWLVVGALVAVAAIVAGSLFMFGVFSPGAAGRGQLAVAVHDAPCSQCTHVWVTFDAAQVHQSNTSGSGWMALNVTTTTVDLMALNGTAFAKVVGIGTLKAGQYEMIRLNISKVVVGLSNGTVVNASLPAVSSADIHGAFNVTAGATTTVSVDIDLASSLHVTTLGGNVMAVFTPNIGAVQVSTS